jgi:hypothetical protein
MVRLYAVEAADNWFEDAGSGQLASGSATIALDQVFAQTVNGDVDYHVFITPNGDCEGLYVANKTANGFEVHELHGGHSNVAFDYRIMARRKGFEKVRMQDVTADFVQMKRESDALATRLEAGKAKAKTRPKPHVTSLGKRLPTSAANVAPSPWSMGQRLTERNEATVSNPIGVLMPIRVSALLSASRIGSSGFRRSRCAHAERS